MDKQIKGGEKVSEKESNAGILIIATYRTRVFIGESNIWRICLPEVIGGFYIGDSSYLVFLLEFLHGFMGVSIVINYWRI